VSTKALWVQDLGRRDYDSTWALQRSLVSRRQEDAVPDILLLVEHPDVITLGRGAQAAQHVHAPGEMAVVEVERGGDVTYHGPGQLVGYPILKLEGPERDLHRYLRNLEEVLIRGIEPFGVIGERCPGYTGVWAQGRKLASIGVAVRRWVTMHGFALNVTTDLSRFSGINPCGLDAAVMASLASLTGRAIPLATVAQAVTQLFGVVFEREPLLCPETW